jgi:phenylacetate-CoA ligase
MPVKQPQPGDLDPIETASRDEIAALQLQRLKWSLQHAYDNVPHYRKKFDDKGVHPNDLNTLADIAKFPFTTKADLRDNYPFGLFAVPRRKGGTGACLVGHHGQTHGGGLHAERHRHAGPTWWPAASAPPVAVPGDIVSCGLRLRPVHRRGLGAHYGAERAGLYRHPHVRWADREAGATDSWTSSPTSSWSRPRTRW